MAAVPVPNATEVEIRGTYNGIPVENTLWFEFASAITEIALDLLTEAISAWFVENFIPFMAPGYVMKEVYARDKSAGSGINSTNTDGAGTVGASSSPGMPGNVAWAVKFVTGLAGRSFRGRNFVTALTEAQCTGNAFASSTADVYTGNYRMLLGGGGILPEDWQWVVVSLFSGGAPRVTGLTTPVSGVTYTDLNIDTQRKRLS